jgi:hypothetical protein
MRELFTTWVTSSTTGATPEQVWRALTCRTSNLGVPAGLVIVSEWVPGASVRLMPDGAEAADALHSEGEVLASVAPFRLSYTLGAAQGGSDPTCIVTWQVAAGDRGTTVTLTVDDFVPDGPEDPEIRRSWERTVAGLTGTLDPAAPHEDTAGER